MRFPPSFLDEIRARLPVSEVVRRRVKLQKSGRELVGLSPFNQERSPSFFVNDQKMAWFDFSSGKNGNIFDFVMETEGLTFPETVERLAQDAGLALPARSADTERQEQRRAGLHEVLEWAAAFFEKELAGTRGGKARGYLDGRAIQAASRAAFRIGYAPAERHALRDALAAKGASVDTMCEAGLLIHGDDIPVPYDKFRDRVMFPIADRSGRIIAFGGRALEKDVQAKYLNSPETPVFHKGRVLFNHHRARKAAHDSGRAIAVEGYIDVVAMHAAGFPETVAALGTALTEEQAGLLWQMSPQPILCFDGDKAGRKAAYRAAEMSLPLIGPSKTFSFCLLPEGQDPDDLIRTAGAGAMRAALETTIPLVDLVWSRETETRILTTPEQRAGLKSDLRTICGLIRDQELRAYYQADFDRRLTSIFGTTGFRENAFKTRERMPWQSSKNRNGFGERAGYVSAPVQASASLAQSLTFSGGEQTLRPREAMIFAILVAHPDLASEWAEDLATLDLAASELVTFRDRLLDFVHDGDLSSSLLREHLASAGFERLLARIDLAVAGSQWCLRSEAASQDVAKILGQALTLHRRKRILINELHAAEERLAGELCEVNLARLRDLQAQLSEVTGMEAAMEGFGSLSGRSVSAL